MILQEGKTIWRRAAAPRAAVLNDAASYFGALRQSLLAAKRSAFLVGWDIHSQTKLVGPRGTADDGLPECLGEFLDALAARNPSLEIFILVWNSVLYANEREWFLSTKFGRTEANRVHFCIDECLPIGSAQHQKLAVIDDSVAYSGGLDLTIRRWDASSHAARNPHRVDPAGAPYPPFHDVQMVVDGEAALALAELVRGRWDCANCGVAPPEISRDANADVWPSRVAPDFENVTVGIARTEPVQPGREEINEVEELFVAMIGAAERSIYFENQYFSSVEIAKRLASRLQERPELEALLIAPRRHESWLEAHTMRSARIDFVKALEEAGVLDRVRMLYPKVDDGTKSQAVMIHSKVMVVDDRILRIGSANINNRSFGVDTECDLAIEAANDGERTAILRVRNALLGHHCGVKGEAVAAQLAREPSLLRAAEHLSANGHSLEPVEHGDPKPDEIVEMLTQVGDPRHPLGLESNVAATFDRRIMIKLALVAVAICVAALAWRFTPLYELADFETLRGAMEDLNGNPLGPLFVVGIFVLGGLILFPVILLIAATAAALGPWLGLGSAVVGVLASATLVFSIGRIVGKKPLQAVLGPRLERIQRTIVGNGVVAVALVRMLPVAPFSLVNIVAGAGGIRYVDFIAGTILGMAPGLIAMSVFGAQIADVLEEPTLWGVSVLVASLLAWLMFSFAAQFVVTWFMNRRKRREA